MTRARGAGPSAEAELVAYLDNQLGPSERAELEARLAADRELQARLAELRAGGRPFKEVFEPLLRAAPTAVLEARLAAIHAYADSRGPQRHGWRRAAMAAAAAVVFSGGFAVDRFAFPLVGIERATEQPEEWRNAVAEYIGLYSSDTLAGVPEDSAARARELENLAARLDLRLTPERLALPDLMLKRAQLLSYDGKPLGQIAYLDPERGPVALCIIADGERDLPVKVEKRRGMNIAYWAKGGRGFMLIGRLPPERLQAMAETIGTRLS